MLCKNIYYCIILDSHFVTEVGTQMKSTRSLFKYIFCLQIVIIIC